MASLQGKNPKRKVLLVGEEQSSTLLETEKGGKQHAARPLPEVLEHDEAEALLSAPNTSTITGLRNRCMLEMMYHAGLRVSEVCNLERGHVDLKNGRVRVKMGKGRVDRNLIVSDSFLDRLRQWETRKKKETAGSEFFFCTIAGGKVSVNYVEKMIKRAAKRAGIEKRVHPHMLRHTCATELVEEGIDLHVIQDILGHADLSTTEIYLHVRPEQVETALKNRRKGK